jgi:hypothetical protein
MSRKINQSPKHQNTQHRENLDYEITQHQFKFSFDRGYTMQYRILKLSNGSLVWWLREDVFRTGKPELVQLVKDYEKVNQDELELEGFDVSSLYDASLGNVNSKSHRSVVPSSSGLGTPSEESASTTSEVSGSVSAQSSCGTTDAVDK